ncbi:MAG: NAD(P)-binding domain-containing protein [Armatimonas sp.]
MTIGIIGSGIVAQTIAAGFLQHGYDTMLGTRAPEKLDAWLGEHPLARVNSVEETAEFGDVLVLAVKGTAALEVLRAIPKDTLAGKLIIDTTNPIADTPPQGGVLAFFTDQNSSLMETAPARIPRGALCESLQLRGCSLYGKPGFPRRQTDYVPLWQRCRCKTNHHGHLRAVRLGDRRHGSCRSSPRHRAALYALVYTRLPTRRVDSRLQVTEVATGAHAPLPPSNRGFTMQ